MANRYDIVNGALVRLGANEIASFDDDSAEAIACRRLYPNTLNDLLSRYPWRFMGGEQQMARLPDAPTAGWDAAYQLPTEVELIRAVTINDHPIGFDRFGDRVHCNATENDAVIVTYTKKVNEEYFPGYFNTLLEYELTAALAVPIGDRGDLAELFEKKALRQFSLAKSVDAQGRTAKRMHTGRFMAARWGARGVMG